MSLIIEDGTIIENANTFATVAECQAFATARGLVLPASSDDVEVLLIIAADFLFSLEGDFQGSREHIDQELPFPRDPVTVFGKDLSGTIPKILKQAQCRLAFDAYENGNELIVNGDGLVVKKEEVGPLSTEFSDGGSSNPQIRLNAALTILDPLFNTPSNTLGGSINITASR